MKYAIIALLFTASTLTTVALAQDGGGHGPPRSLIIVMPQPTAPSPTKPLQKLFQPKSRLVSMTH
jgi:hypothetical protein